MGRNKLSPTDRIKKFGFYNKKIEQCKEGNPTPILIEINTIRSKSLRTFVAFWLSQLDEYNFAHDHSIKELSEKMGIGERTIHDYIKARKILGEIEEVAFGDILSSINKMKQQ